MFNGVCTSSSNATTFNLSLVRSWFKWNTSLRRSLMFWIFFISRVFSVLNFFTSNFNNLISSSLWLYWTSPRWRVPCKTFILLYWRLSSSFLRTSCVPNMSLSFIILSISFLCRAMSDSARWITCLKLFSSCFIDSISRFSSDTSLRLDCNSTLNPSLSFSTLLRTGRQIVAWKLAEMFVLSKFC